MRLMDEEIKRGLKKIGRNAEIRVTESILRWKYRKEGKEIPDDQNLEQQSRLIADQTHQTLSRRGKNIWNELKNAYRKGQSKEDERD